MSVVDGDERVTEENSRLRRENARLRERVTALEASRWWRLHPRRVLRRLRPREASPRPDDAEAQRSVPLDGPADVLARRFAEEVVGRGTFTEEWSLANIPTLAAMLDCVLKPNLDILEVGSFEGLSTCFFLWQREDATVTCVDTFAGSVEHVAYGSTVSDLEARFEANTALVDRARVRKLRGDSRRVLLDLAENSARFDLIYVDGSHVALDVLVDAALAWQLLRIDGILLFDDYRWRGLGHDPLVRPGPAIDAFSGIVLEHAETLFRGSQFALRKRD